MTRAHPWIACTLFIIAVLPTVAQPAQRTPTTTPTGNTRKDQSIVDFALKGINSKDANYGQCIDEARSLLIHETVGRAYFWSNLAAISAVILLFVIVLHQRKFQQRCEDIAAHCLSQYHNALMRAQTHANEAAARNHELMQALTQSAAPTRAEEVSVENDGPQMEKPRKIGRPPRTDAPARTSSNEGALPVTPPAAELPPSLPKTIADATTAGTKDQMGLFSAEVDLVARVNALQQQLGASQERERHLRRQLNERELRTQKEEQKARAVQP